MSSVTRAVRAGVIACAAIAASVDRAEASEIWVAPSYQQDVGGLGIGSNGVWPVTAAGVVRLAWGVPDDLELFASARLVLIPHAPGGAATLNLFVCAAASGDMVAAACTGPFAHAFTGVANQLLEVDVSAAIGPQVGVAGVTHLAVVAYTTPTTATDHIVGLRFAYEALPPDDVAGLGANTFTGTQTAPAFVGDGSGLTNLPAPPGVATLGANMFTGTQTAPAFVGDGSGLTNLPVPAGVATLGANTFAGTQTIDAGNVDLDPSTPTSGQLTQGGTPLLHTFGSANTFLGQSAGNLAMTGTGNTAAGRSAFRLNESGSHNTAVGVVALESNSSGSFNTAFGREALWQNSTADANTAMGFQVLRHTTTGHHNTAIGTDAIQNDVTGSGNTAIGAVAMHNNLSGSSNTAIGGNALQSNDGNNNVAVGVLAGFNATTGSNNIYMGTDVRGVAGEANTMYLGRVGTQTKTVIAGVRDTTVAGGEVVVVDAAGRLGSTPVLVPGPESVGSNEVADDSLTAGDLADEQVTDAHYVHDFFHRVTLLPRLDMVIRSVEIAAPTSGHVIVNASGYIIMGQPRGATCVSARPPARANGARGRPTRALRDRSPLERPGRRAPR